MTVSAAVVGGRPLSRYGLIRALEEGGLHARVLQSVLLDETIGELDVLVVCLVTAHERTIVKRARRLSSELPIVAIIPTPAKRAPDLHSALLADGATTTIPDNAPHSLIATAVRAAVAGWTLIVTSSVRARALGDLFREILSGLPPTLESDELLLLQHLAHGQTREAIAEEFHIATRTVDRRLEEIYRKLDASSRTDAVLGALLWGLLIDE